jgi:hypothetical protein
MIKSLKIHTKKAIIGAIIALVVSFIGFAGNGLMDKVYDLAKTH